MLEEAYADKSIDVGDTRDNLRFKIHVIHLV